MNRAALVANYLDAFQSLANKSFCEALTIREIDASLLLEVPLESGMTVWGHARAESAQWGVRVDARKCAAEEYAIAMERAGALLAPMSLMTISVSAFLLALQRTAPVTP